LGQDGQADWRSFIDRRTSSFHVIDCTSHEFLAQAITYACLLKHNDRRIGRLVDIFDELEKKQPTDYAVPNDIKAAAMNVD
jgi:hypothetical protein